MPEGYQEPMGHFEEQPEQYESHHGGQMGGQQFDQQQMGRQSMGQPPMGRQSMGQQPMGGQFEDYLTGDLRIALDDINEAEQIAAWCADLCIDEGPQMSTCIRLCQDVADLASLAEKLIARESIFVPEITQALIQAADECARECEQYQTEHCQETASVLHRLVDSASKMLQTTYDRPVQRQFQQSQQGIQQQPNQQF